MTINLPIVQPNCMACPLSYGCDGEFIVWGEGETNSPDLFIIGEGPGAQEHYQHRPFVGDSGKLLRETLKAIDEQTDHKGFTYYLTNTVMCRPPDNRTPTQDEVTNCMGRLISEIEVIKPKAILILGGTAVEALLNEKHVSKVRGKMRQFMDIPCLATWHPAYILGHKKGSTNYLHFKTFSDDIVRLLDNTNNQTTTPLLDMSRWGQYIEITEPKELSKLFHEIERDSPLCPKGIDISFDIETLGTDPHKGFIFYYGFDYKDQTYIFLPEVYNELDPNAFPFGASLTVHQSFMELPWMKRHHGFMLDNVDDTLLMYHLCDERTRGVDKDLKTAAMELLNAPDWASEIKPYITCMHNAPKELAMKYLACDCQATTALKKKLDSMMVEDDVADYYYKIKRPAITFVNRMSAHGFRVDLEYLEKQDAVFTGYLEGYRNEEGEWVKGHKEVIQDIIGDTKFNPGSSQQVSYQLYNQWGLPNKNKNSTDESAVKELLEYCYDHELEEQSKFLETLMEYRETSKLLSTYIRGLYKHTAPDGRIHTRIKLEGTATGRMSSAEPNLHNIPIRGKYGNLIRQAFLPDEGYLLADNDYNQLELVVGAHCSDDENLISYINSGGDLHRAMGALILGKPEEEVTKLERQFAKNMDFAVMYDADPRELVYTFKKDFPFLTLALAKKAINTVRHQFPDLHLNALRYKTFAKKNGYVTTMFGMKRRFPLLTQENHKKVMGQVSNMPIQGAASDICLLSAMRIERELPDVKTHILVHDSIVASVPNEQRAYDMKEIMEDVPFEHKVNFTAKVTLSERWGAE